VNSSERPGALVPPRPNLGPEPLDEGMPTWPWVVAALATLVTAAVLRRSRGPKRRPTAAPTATDPGLPLSLKERTSGLSASIRRALAGRFDETWLAKTTEEIAVSDSLAAELGDEDANGLVEFLRSADVVKFAYPPDQRGDLDARLTWAESFLAAGASSKRTGK
jgi:hypothetical protein